MSKLVHLKDVEHHANTVVTVGTFDGVHGGHKALMEKVIEKAQKRNARSVVITFDPHPREIINPGREGIKLLSTLQERCEILADLGIDELVVIPFDRDFSLLSSEDFVVNIVHRLIGVSEFVIGYDHQFGKDREGSIDTIKRVGAELGFDAYVVSKKEMGETTISSTVIRRTISEKGDVKYAAALLGRAYMLNGMVMHGDERGREIGFPTANINPEHPNKIVPKQGVYAVMARVDDVWYKGMMNIGVRPTFDGETTTLEVNIFDFDATIYGKKVQVRFIDRIRDEQKFSGIEEIKEQLKKDRDAALVILNK